MTFFSNTYGGRASDKFNWSHSEFVDYLDSYDEVVADRGFHITEEPNIARYCAPRIKGQIADDQFRRKENEKNLLIKEFM